MAVEALKLLQNTAALKPAGVPAPAAAGEASGFADKLASLVSTVDESAADANRAVSNMVNKTGDVHDAMISLQRAEMSLQFTVAIRNKLVQAYQDIMRMPV